LHRTRANRVPKPEETVPTIQTNGLQVIAVYVSDLARSVAFYRDHLGFGGEEPLGDGVLLKANSLSIYIEAGRTAPAGDAMTSPTVAMCLGAPSIRTAFDAATRARITHGPLQQFAPDFAMFRVADPDGLLIEFAGKP
jgi:catechol 2,3-dioxygenase-like lactoylglutathione lyase family enzyme